MAKGRLQKGIYARTPKGFNENVKVMEKAGYPKKRAVGTAYGEADLDKDKEYNKLMNHIKNL